jgi:hypothetical protein
MSVLGNIQQQENKIYEEFVSALEDNLGVGDISTLVLDTTGTAEAAVLPDDALEVLTDAGLTATHFNTRLQTSEDLSIVQDTVGGGDLTYYIYEYSTLVAPVTP